MSSLVGFLRPFSRFLGTLACGLRAFKPVGWAKSSLARSGSTSKGGKTGENGGCEVAGSVAMRCAILCVIGRQFPSSKLRPESLRETWLPSLEANLCCSN
jgi:hypothetical protein